MITTYKVVANKIKKTYSFFNGSALDIVNSFSPMGIDEHREIIGHIVIGQYSADEHEIKNSKEIFLNGQLYKIKAIVPEIDTGNNVIILDHEIVEEDTESLIWAHKAFVREIKNEILKLKDEIKERDKMIDELKNKVAVVSAKWKRGLFDLPKALPQYIWSAPDQKLPVIEKDFSQEEELKNTLGYFDERTGEIGINIKLDPVGKHHILLHEMIHLAIGKLKQGNFINEDPSEKFVTYLTGALFPMLAMSNLWNGVSPEEAYEFIMNYEKMKWHKEVVYLAISYGTQVWGSIPLNLNSPLTIDELNNTLSFDVDNVTYTITIPNGTYKTNREYFTSELIDPINIQLQLVSAPVFVRLGGINGEEHINVLVFEHNDKTQHHVINNFTGSALNDLFGEIKFELPPRTI